MIERPDSRKAYLKMVEEFPFKVGDFVTVTEKANDYENFWEEEWVTEMDKFIGKNCKIVELDEYNKGVKLYFSESDREYRFPIYLIDAISIPKVKLTINDETYIIEVSENSREILLENRKDLIRLELQL